MCNFDGRFNNIQIFEFYLTSFYALADREDVSGKHY